MTTDEIPQVLFKIYRVDAEVYGTFFFHGYFNSTEDCMIFKSESVDECKEFAQNHWNEYVLTNFMESGNA